MRSGRRVELMLKILIGLAVANLALLASVLLVVLSVEAPEDDCAPGLAAAPAAVVAPAASTPAARASGPSGSRLRSPTGSDAGPPATIEELIAVTVGPLEQAAADRGIDVSAHLPTAAERAAVAAEGTLDSPPGEVVLEKLKAGYQAVGMPFPDIPMEPQGAPEEPVEAAAAPGQAVDAKAVETWLQLTVANARKAAEASGAELTLPSEEAQAAAVASGRFDSAASREVIGPLRDAYGALGIDFPEPGGAPPPTGAASTAPAAPAASSAGTAGETQQQKILRAYFTVRNRDLRRAAADQGKEDQLVLPEGALVDAAIASGDIRSEASRAALDAYADAFEQWGLTWRDPVGG